MIVYLAGENGKTRFLNEIIGGGYEHLPCWGASSEKREISTRGGHKILESYYYARDNEIIQKLFPSLGDLLLDSGAFSFMMNNKAVAQGYERYTEEYAEFVNRHKIEKFIEMDIDSIVGLKQVERLRAKLERLTGRQPIPVWHIQRGKDYFVGMCKDYKYVAFGGLMSDGVSRQRIERAFPWFINTAHELGAKIHGLGYTSIEGLYKYHFDSVDSTAWLYGNRAGYLYKFNQRTGRMDKIQAPSGYRLKSTDAARWNFNEWIKFQQYAERNL